MCRCIAIIVPSYGPVSPLAGSHCAPGESLS